MALDDLSPDHLLPVAAAVAHLSPVTVDGDVAVAVRHGKVLERADLGIGEGDGPWAVLDVEGDLLAVFIAHKGTTVKPEVVVAGSGG